MIARQKDSDALPNVLAVRELVVSSDAQTIKTLSQVMEQSAVHVEVTPNPESAISELCRKKYEAVVVDLQNQQDSQDRAPHPLVCKPHLLPSRLC